MFMKCKWIRIIWNQVFGGCIDDQPYQSHIDIIKSAKTWKYSKSRFAKFVPKMLPGNKIKSL